LILDLVSSPFGSSGVVDKEVDGEYVLCLEIDSKEFEDDAEGGRQPVDEQEEEYRLLDVIDFVPSSPPPPDDDEEDDDDDDGRNGMDGGCN